MMCLSQVCILSSSLNLPFFTQEKSFMLQAAARLRFDRIGGTIRIDLTFCQFLYNQSIEFHVGINLSVLTTYSYNVLLPNVQFT